ncbi:MAG: type IX secretion system membrane protein PorP/SprF [Bacteroidota bacterium]|jgi:type IX secretion system PorP/SprF family membrane protein
MFEQFKKLCFVLVLYLPGFFILSQQNPFWSQHRGSLFLFNPAVAGSRKIIDVRLGYRQQWVGYEGAPKTMCLTVHGKLLKEGKIGVGGILLKDEIGPFRYFSASGAVSYHIRFEDAKLSMGIGGGYQSQGYFSDRVTTQFQQDPAVNYNLNDKVSTGNMSAGLLYYNDKFYIGLSTSNLFSSRFEYYKKDTTRKATFAQILHYNFAVGYNWQVDNSVIWENSFMANYSSGAPILADYTLRLHIKERLITGFSYRLKSAVAFHLGYTIDNTYQISYSYDLSTNNLRSTNSGTHEIKLIFGSNLFQSDRKNRNKEFQRRHYNYLY